MWDQSPVQLSYVLVNQSIQWLPHSWLSPSSDFLYFWSGSLLLLVLSLWQLQSMRWASLCLAKPNFQLLPVLFCFVYFIPERSGFSSIPKKCSTRNTRNTHTHTIGLRNTRNTRNIHTHYRPEKYKTQETPEAMLLLTSTGTLKFLTNQMSQTVMTETPSNGAHRLTHHSPVDCSWLKPCRINLIDGSATLTGTTTFE